MRHRSIDVDEVITRIRRDGIQAVLTRGEAVALVATRINQPYPPDKSERNRVGNQLDRDARNGTVPRGAAKNTYVAKDVIAWARDMNTAPFDDLPPTPRLITDLVESKATAWSSVHTFRRPTTLEGCYRLIDELQEEIDTLKAERANAEEERRRELGRRFRKRH